MRRVWVRNLCERCASALSDVSGEHLETEGPDGERSRDEPNDGNLGTPERHRRLFEQKGNTVSLQRARARARELEQR